jgi:hypothetical protein
MKKKILGGIAIVVFITIVVFNINVIVNDGKGSNLIKLVNVDGLVATAEPDGKPKELPKKTTRVHCVVKASSVTTTTNNNNSNSNYGASASVTAGYGIVSGNVSGNYNSGSSSGNTSVTTTNYATSSDFWADKIMCQQQDPGSCTPYDPCK